jgi:hypothetical protein
MAGYLKQGEPRHYWGWLRSLREQNELNGKPVESWRAETSADGLHLLLSVTYAPVQPQHQGPLGTYTPTNWGITETHSFPALAVLALKDEEERIA